MRKTHKHSYFSYHSAIYWSTSQNYSQILSVQHSKQNNHLAANANDMVSQMQGI